MNKENLYLQSRDGKTKLHVILWTPEGKPSAVLQLVHGMVEYIDRYDAFARFLAEKGFAVIGHDHLGHGESVTDEQHLGFFADEHGDEIVIEDMHQVTEEGRKRFPGVPFFILGHSMGSFMVRRYLTKYSEGLQGAVIMGTGNIPGIAAATGLLLAKAVMKTKGPLYRSGMLTGLALGQNNKPFRPNRTSVDWLSRNEENVDRYVADPLCGYEFTASAYRDFFTVMKKLAAKEDFSNIRKDLPVLITSGEEDPVGGKKACPAVRDSLVKLGLTDLTMKLYPEDRHEILNEVDREQVCQDLYAWFISKL